MTGNDRIVEDYLARLDAALATASPDRRSEILEEIAQHIAEARAELPVDDEVALRNALDRIGEPEEIAADAGDPPAPAPAAARGRHETIAIVLLLVGGFAWGVGWLIGVVLLWLSNVWTTRDKLIGTFVVPGGLSLALFFGLIFGRSSSTSCIGLAVDNGSTSPAMTCTHTGPGPLSQVLLWVLFAAVVAAPVGTSIYLARRSRPS